MNKYNKIIVLMKSAGRKVYVNKTPSATPVLIKEEQKVIPMDLDHPNPSIMSSLSPGQSINATLKGKNVKIVNVSVLFDRILKWVDPKTCETQKGA